MKKIYAQINPAGVCVGVSELSGKVEAPHLIEIEAFDESLLGKRRNGDKWETVAPTEAELAALELAQIDAATGMSRTMREVLLALAAKVGADVAHLQAQETKAAAARAKLGK